MEALALQNAAPAARSLRLGPSVLLEDKYRLERVLGAGAMGRVWLARNVRLDAPVAIKIVERESHGAEAMKRVLTEARLEARLRHPNIVRVLDCHANQELSYVVMELLEGCTLADLMDEGPLPPALAVRLLLPLIDGLALAHRAGVVHRDIKPENVFVARAGERVSPKLLDFGVAHVADDGAARKRRLIVGTPGYMAPEQAFGERDIDGRADIWSLGVVLYEAIRGESAYGSSSYQQYVRALNERVLPPLPQSGGGVELWRIVQRALCPTPLGRFRSCTELGDALRGWLRSRGVREDLTGDSLPASWVMPGSIVDRALTRAIERDLSYGERDSFAPTQLDMTTRRKEQRSAEQQTPRSMPGSGERPLADRASRARPSQPTAAGPSSRASTIRTLPRPLAGRARGWSAYALAAGAALGVGFALAQAHGEAPPAARAHGVHPVALLAPARPSERALTAPPAAAPATSADAPDTRQAVAKKPASARPRAHKPRAADKKGSSLHEQASALGLKSPW
jgi:serine/threonine-protein kinase